MPMDDTDKRLVNGLMWIAGVCIAAYVMPWVGYTTQVATEEQARTELLETGKKYRKWYPDLPAPVTGRAVVTDDVEDANGIPMSDMHQALIRSNKELDANIEVKEKDSKMGFPPWTVIPEAERRHPGTYFKIQFEEKQKEVDDALHKNQVQCDDQDIGFSQYSGKAKITELEAGEYLRELAIAQEVINLCIGAKVSQEQSERGRGEVPEAFMRIVEVSPEPSVAVGPTIMKPNPNYSDAEHAKNPLSKNAQKYLIEYKRAFIQEYPVRVVLECDFNTFERFLYSVRDPGKHFLVIRNLEIVSPYIVDSQKDFMELRGGQDAKSPLEKANTKLDNRHIQVTISAAGMDFFDPIKNPNGLSAPAEVKQIKPKHIMPMAVPAGQAAAN